LVCMDRVAKADAQAKLGCWVIAAIGLVLILVFGKSCDLAATAAALAHVVHVTPGTTGSCRERAVEIEDDEPIRHEI